jgi:hypothetical protein
MQPNLASRTRDRTSGWIPGLTERTFFAMLSKRKNNR